MNRQAPRIRTAIYARIDAGKQGDECAKQVRRLKEHVESDVCCSLAGVYADNGVSANAHRPEYEELLLDRSTGKYDEILAIDLSRLERDTSKLIRLAERLASVNVRIVTVQGDHTLLPLISGSVINDG